MPDGRFVIVETAMRAQRFPVSESELLTQIAAFELYQKLSDILKGKDEPESEKIFMQILSFKKKSYEMRGFGGYREYQ